MLNYIWAGLIIVSFVFGIVRDSYDLAQNTYQNGREWQVEVNFPQQSDLTKAQRVKVAVLPADSTTIAQWNPLKSETQLIFSNIQELPKLWQKIAENQPDDDKDKLTATLLAPGNIDGNGTYKIKLPEVKFVSMRNIASAAFDMAEFAVKLAIGLIGAMALWLGLMKIAEESGLIKIFNRVVEPALKYLFPDVPKDHPALSAISLNMAANVLGLSNAATPLGIKAMEELQKLNKNKEEASDAMCMFLAINTSSVQLLPPVTLVAIMGVAVNELMIGIILATTFSTIIGITSAKWLRWRHYRKLHPGDA